MCKWLMEKKKHALSDEAQFLFHDVDDQNLVKTACIHDTNLSYVNSSGSCWCFLLLNSSSNTNL